MAKIDPELLLSGANSVLPALSPDGRTSERSFQTTQDILEQAGILKKRVTLRRARHQRVPEQMISRGRLFLYRLLFGLSAAVFLGAELGKIDRSVLGVEPVASFWLSL